MSKMIADKTSDSKRLVVIGATGAGKSTLANVLAGKGPNDDLFPAGHTMGAKTHVTTVQSVKWLGDENNFDVDIIDTPGLDDPAGPKKDGENIAKMVKELKKLGHVNLFLIVFNGSKVRLDRTMKELLKIFNTMFGPGFLNNTMFEVTNWGYDKEAIRKRKMQNAKTEASWQKDLNANLRAMELNPTKDIPAVFIDGMYNPDDETQDQEFHLNLGHLRAKLENAEKFSCEDFQVAKRDVEEAQEKALEAEKKTKQAEEDAKKAEAEREKERKEEREREIEAKRDVEEAEEKVLEAEKKTKQAKEDAKKAEAAREKEKKEEREKEREREIKEKKAEAAREKERKERVEDHVSSVKKLVSKHEYSVTFQLTIKNNTDHQLNLDKCNINAGLVNPEPNSVVNPKESSSMGGHKKFGACGCEGTVAWQIGSSGKMVVVMYSFPYNFNHFTNTCAIGIFNYHPTFETMYESGGQEFARKEFRNSGMNPVEHKHRDDNYKFRVTAKMGEGHLNSHLEVSLDSI